MDDSRKRTNFTDAWPVSLWNQIIDEKSLHNAVIIRCKLYMESTESHETQMATNANSPPADVTSIGKNGQVHRASNNTEQPTKAHKKCCAMVEKSCSAKYVKILMDGLLKLGCATSAEQKNIVCEPCTPRLVAAFDIDKNQIVVCENDLFSQKFMDDVMTHELIHAYDVCRVKFDRDNLKHLACSSIRVANLTGECFFWKENFLRFRFGWRYQQQNCVRNMAVKHMMASKEIDKKTAESAVESVFDACFNDHEPFIRIPP